MFAAADRALAEVWRGDPKDARVARLLKACRPPAREARAERERVGEKALQLDQTATIWAVILPGAAHAPELPLFVRQALWVDMRDWENEESDGFYRLVCGILGKAPGDSPMTRFGVRDVAEWQGRSF